MPPITLAIEVSQRQAGVAVSDTSGAVHVESLRGDTRHDDDLMPAIERLCADRNILPESIEVVGVSIGPGGFTGLRIAVTTAKMLALINPDVKVVAIPSALVAACSTAVPDEARRVIVILSGKRGSAWITTCARSGVDQPWSIVDTPGLMTVESLDLAHVDAVLADEHQPRAMLESASGAGRPIIEPTFDPAACLHLTAQTHERGETVDPLQLSPLYPREPEAVTLWNSRHGNAG